MSVETAKKLINDVLLDFTEFLDEKDNIHKKQIKEAILQIVTLYGNIYRTLGIGIEYKNPIILGNTGRVLLEWYLNIFIIVDSNSKEEIIKRIDAYQEFEIYYATVFGNRTIDKVEGQKELEQILSDKYGYEIGKERIMYRWHLVGIKKSIKQMLKDIGFNGKDMFDNYEFFSFICHPNYLSTREYMFGFDYLSEKLEGMQIENTLKLVKKLDSVIFELAGDKDVLRNRYILSCGQ